MCLYVCDKKVINTATTPPCLTNDLISSVASVIHGKMHSVAENKYDCIKPMSLSNEDRSNHGTSKVESLQAVNRNV